MNLVFTSSNLFWSAPRPSFTLSVTPPNSPNLLARNNSPAVSAAIPAITAITGQPSATRPAINSLKASTTGIAASLSSPKVPVTSLNTLNTGPIVSDSAPTTPTTAPIFITMSCVGPSMLVIKSSSLLTTGSSLLPISIAIPFILLVIFSNCRLVLFSISSKALSAAPAALPMLSTFLANDSALSPVIPKMACTPSMLPSSAVIPDMEPPVASVTILAAPASPSCLTASSPDSKPCARKIAVRSSLGLVSPWMAARSCVVATRVGVPWAVTVASAAAISSNDTPAALASGATWNMLSESCVKSVFPAFTAVKSTSAAFCAEMFSPAKAFITVVRPSTAV